MKKEFVPYEQALALKELGFDEHCIAEFYINKQNYYELLIGFPENCPTNIKAPLYQQAFRWFREEHQLQHEIVYDISDDLINKVYVYTIFGTDRSEEYKTYEEAELGELKKLIEIVKNK